MLYNLRYSKPLNELIESKFYLDNYKCSYTNSESLIIYLSSHGLYYPDTIDEFKVKILVQDRYEWEKFHKKYFQQHSALFVRDITKTFYQNGLNQRLNTFKKTEDFIVNIAKQYKKVVLIGISAGGHLALHLSNRMRALTLAVGPQFHLDYLKNDLAYEGIYDNTVTSILNKSETICYYSIFNRLDLMQLKHCFTKAQLNIYFSRNHGYVNVKDIRDWVTKYIFI